MPILSIVLFVLALICILGAGSLIMRGLRYRGKARRAMYDVTRQEQRRNMLAALFWGGLLLLVSAALSVGFTVTARERLMPDPTAIPTVTLSPSATASVTPTETPTQIAPLVNDTPEATPTTPPDIPTRTPVPPTQTPTLTPTPEPPTAIVNSPNGLWLREAPGGTQEVELIPDGTELILLEGQETVDDLEWRQVQTPIANVGWVATEFIILPEE